MCQLLVFWGCHCFGRAIASLFPNLERLFFNKEREHVRDTNSPCWRGMCGEIYAQQVDTEKEGTTA